MADVILNHMTNGQNISTANTNFDKIQDNINNHSLQKDGGNNVLYQDLDLNGHSLLNLHTDISKPGSALSVADGDARYYLQHQIPIPASNLDAANKQYVDTQVQSVNLPQGFFQQAGTGSVQRTWTDKVRETVSVKDFGAVADRTTNASTAFQATINYVLSLYQATGNAYGLPTVIIPGGSYKLNSPLITYPFITIRAEGSVLLDFSSVALSSTAITISGVSGMVIDILKQSGQRAPCLDGSTGSISILGPGRATSTGTGILLGNSSSSLSDVRDTYLQNVVVTGFNTGLQLGQYNTYLVGARGSRFEQNNRNLVTPVTATNSGERITFQDCTFGGSVNQHVLHQCTGGYDLNFIDCSFDFTSGDIITASGSGFCTITFDSACHFEAWDGYLVNAITPATNFSVNFDSIPSCLPRNSTNTAGINSPSRVLFNSTGTNTWSLYLSEVNFRYEAMPYLFDQDIFSGTNVQVFYNRQTSWGYSTCPVALTVRNRDYKFQSRTNGTSVPNSPATSSDTWLVAPGVSGVTSTFVTSSTGISINALAAGAPSVTYRGNVANALSKTAVRPGQRLRVNVGLSLNDVPTTATVNATTGIQFYDDNGAVISTLTNATINATTYFTNSSAPNFASGTSRYIDLHGGALVAPAGAAYAVAQVSIGGNYSGNLRIGAIRLWES